MLLLVDDIHLGSHHEGGSGSTTNPVYFQSGSATSADGRGYKWQLETTDGKAASALKLSFPFCQGGAVEM